tara:strand:+ start:72 stop:674 length:603 start_codon:yes stop_codon:yes gene_type:complete
MPYNVDNFSAQIAKKGIASPNKFAVKFTRVPSIALGKDKHSDLNLMCESVALAGRSVQSLLDRQYGLNREVAYNGPTYTPITLAFLCSANYVEKRIFDRWNNMVVDISKGYDVAYYNSYIGEMQVIALDIKGNAAFTMIYKECWPKTISAIELNHSTVNTPVRITVEMQYAYWISTDIKSSNDRAGSSVVYEAAEAHHTN